MWKSIRRTRAASALDGSPAPFQGEESRGAQLTAAPSATARWEWARVGYAMALAVCVLAGVLATVPHSPANFTYAWPDGGTFLYIGQRILAGELPYRDAWDHKPPLIYYVNALGLLLGNGTLWGVWLLEALAVAGAALLSFRLLARAFGAGIALLATVMWLLPFVFLSEDGNMTETYALPLQFGCLWLAYASETSGGGIYQWRGLALGILLGLIFFLKSNEIGVGLAIGGYILLTAYRRGAWRRALANLAWIGAGFGGVTVAIVSWLAVQGILYDFWLAAFVFNAIYSTRFEFWSSRAEALAAGYDYLVGTGLVLFGLMGFVIGVNGLLFFRERIPPSLRPLLGMASLALPLEIVLVTTSGRPFDHYFIALVYVLAVWSGWALWFFLDAVLRWMPPNPRARAAVTLSLGVVLALTLLPTLKKDVEWAQSLHGLEPPAVVEYIRQHTQPTDTVLVLGHEARILFFAGRRSPTRFVYQSAFDHPRFMTQALAEEFFTDVVKAKPALIVDVRGDGLVNRTGIQTTFIRRRIGTLQRIYHPIASVGGWKVYAPTEGE